MPQRVFKQKVQFIVSTSATLATDKVNEWLEKNYNDNIDVLDIKPIMSYTSCNNKGSMMIGCLITYIKYDNEFD